MRRAPMDKGVVLVSTVFSWMICSILVVVAAFALREIL